MHKLLVVDDEESVRYSFAKLLPQYEVTGAKDGTEALQLMERSLPDLVILDIQMPGLSGLEVIKKIKDLWPQIPVLMITAHGDSDRVIAAMRHGAYDYIVKPFDVPRMKTLIAEAVDAGQRMRAEVRLGSAVSKMSGERIIGSSSAMREVCKMIGRVAASDANVLLFGESGTGKELVARAIHQYSDRAHKPFLAVNCAAIPETLLESELFGYEKGAFTGAAKRRLGKFEQCNGGTIFLDEIGDMGFSTQAKLLRVLQEGTFERLAGDETLEVDVRFIAATNQNLERAIAEKKFREDLYYRLKVITITLPPLRVRKEDLPELVQHFVARFGAQFGKPGISLAPETLRVVHDYDWPGNVRELENALKRAILLCKDNVILPDLMATEFTTKTPDLDLGIDELSVRVPRDLDAHRGKLYDLIVSELEHKLIVAVLRKVEGNQVRASQILGISRPMLHDRIKRYGIKTEVIVHKL